MEKVKGSAPEHAASCGIDYFELNGAFIRPKSRRKKEKKSGFIKHFVCSCAICSFQ